MFVHSVETATSEKVLQIQTIAARKFPEYVISCDYVLYNNLLLQ